MKTTIRAKRQSEEMSKKRTDFELLIIGGMNQKDASNLVCVSETTATQWTRNARAHSWNEIEASLLNRLTVMLKSPQSDPKDIYNLTNSLKVIGNIVKGKRLAGQTLKRELSKAVGKLPKEVKKTEKTGAKVVKPKGGG